MNKKIEITEEKIQAAYEVASPETKKVLSALFAINDTTPTLDDYKTIKTYEDACEVLGYTPIFNENIVICADFPDHYEFRQDMPKHIIALMKLEIISKALWGRNFQPQPEADKSYFYPWFALFTKEEIDRIGKEDFGALLSASAHDGASAGFGYLYTSHRSSYSGAYVGFRLCQENSEKAKYFGTQFIELWADYLAFNFTTGSKLTR